MYYNYWQNMKYMVRLIMREVKPSDKNDKD